MYWMDEFDDREKKMIIFARQYEREPFGLPGHALLVIIAKLCAVIDKRWFSNVD